VDCDNFKANEWVVKSNVICNRVQIQVVMEKSGRMETYRKKIGQKIAKSVKVRYYLYFSIFMIFTYAVS